MAQFYDLTQYPFHRGSTNWGWRKPLAWCQTAAMLVDIANLWVRFPTPHGLSDAVRGVSLTLGQEKLGIVGESGSASR